MRESNRNGKVSKCIRRIELVQRRSIMYYQQQKFQSFLKIVVALPTMVASCRGNHLLFFGVWADMNCLLERNISRIAAIVFKHSIMPTVLCEIRNELSTCLLCRRLASVVLLHLLESCLTKVQFQNFAGILDRGIQIEGLGMRSFMTYESNILFALRFMVDCNVVGGNWIEVPAGKYQKTSRNLSYCQLEFDCLYLLYYDFKVLLELHSFFYLVWVDSLLVPCDP